MPSEWQKDTYAAKLLGRQVFFSSGSDYTRLSSQDGLSMENAEVLELTSTQEETDTRIGLHCCHQASTCPSSQGISVRSNIPAKSKAASR